MSLSYAGVSLSPLTAEQAAWVDYTLKLQDIALFQIRHDKSQTQSRLSIPNVEESYKGKVGVLRWPIGARRWACGLYTATSSQLEAIKAIVYAGGGYVPANLVIGDGSGGANRGITTSMYMLPSNPILQVPGTNGLYLLALVDARYWWWYSTCSLNVAAPTGTTTYGDLYSQLGSALGVSITHDTVDPDYLAPGPAHSCTDEYVSLLLDSVAFNCGQRITRQLDGTIRAINASSANTSDTANLALGFRLHVGGYLDATELVGYIPDQVAVYFPDLDTPGTGFTDTHAIGGLNAAYTKTLKSSGLSSGDAIWYPGNTAALQAFTDQFSNDWFSWQQGGIQATYAGICNWNPQGNEDMVEWYYHENQICTRVVRGAFQDLTEDLLHVLPSAGGFPTTINNLTIDITNSIFNITNSNLNYTAVTNFINNLTFRSTTNNFTGILIGTWLEICGVQCWCCEEYEFTDASVSNWLPPAPATVYPVTANGGGTVLTSIVPAGLPQVLQITVPNHVASAHTLTGSFMNGTTSGSTIIVKVWGKSSAALTGRTMTDSQSNTYTEDAYLRDVVTGIFSGIYRTATTGSVGTVTFTFTGTDGPLVLVAEEVTNIKTSSPVDEALTDLDTSASATAGTFNPAGPYEYMTFNAVAYEFLDPSIITSPSGVASLYQEQDGGNYVPGNTGFHSSNSTPAFTPTYTIDNSVPWVATGVSYKTVPCGQVMVITNIGEDQLVIPNGGSSSGSGKPILIPDKYHDLPSGPYQITLEQYDSVLLWFDACDQDAWRVISATSSGLITKLNGGTGIVEPHLNFIEGSGVTITTSADHTNRKVDITISSDTTGGGGFPDAIAFRGVSDFPVAISLSPGDDTFATFGTTGGPLYDTNTFYIGGIVGYLVVQDAGYYHFDFTCDWTGFQSAHDLAIENSLECFSTATPSTSGTVLSSKFQGRTATSIFASGDLQTLSDSQDWLCSAGDTITINGGNVGSTGYSTADWITTNISIHKWAPPP